MTLEKKELLKKLPPPGVVGVVGEEEEAAAAVVVFSLSVTIITHISGYSILTLALLLRTFISHLLKERKREKKKLNNAPIQFLSELGHQTRQSIDIRRTLYLISKIGLFCLVESSMICACHYL